MAFTWGVSTAAYQIEGGAAEGGRGRSIWDAFSHEPGRISDGGTGDVACDHFHRYPEDIDLMAGLGIDAYRFSVAWPRVQPDGTGPANAAGVDFYDRLVDALLAKGIDPVVTLFHWDLPQALEDKGGWLSRDTSFRFADYAGLVAGAIGDRVRLWITLNEPFVHMTLGYATGEHAPGRTLLFDALPVAHHQLLGHGLAVAALRAQGAGAVAITNNYTPVWPVGDTEADAAAAAAYHALHNRLFTDPLFGRGYPELGLDPAAVHDGDLDTIAAPLDALGVNYYNPTGVRAPSTPDSPLPFELVPIAGYLTTAFGWPVVPDGLRQLLVSLKEEYGASLPPIHVTESGCAYDGIDDPERVAYLDGHIGAMRSAMASGVDVRGYFVWSLLDNFEWAEGYTKRFGLVHVDYDTQVRTPKTSYAWYRDLVRASR
ncbi:GH1 family beta-glucosidase [Phytohabitans suffuscus]|uniref:Beta-glucosidase n=1 Tax=Phytohabitans suffuscus TaxID=624315 RepID=A0A6F8YDS4_9ACTN|nr:GH1 family beta-glucosidase [Phytohabitans suffuscus]BCB84128.1 beta-glucosidase [Phytohabitans suffuscus]